MNSMGDLPRRTVSLGADKGIEKYLPARISR